MEERLLESSKVSIFAPKTHVDLHWRDVTYSIKGKPILKGLDGLAQNSKLTAIMGASGAGKTTLLNYLSCRLSNSRTNKKGGKAYANGLPFTAELFGKTGAYVMQDDILLDTLTPRETLYFSAKLKLNLPDEERRIRVEELLKSLKLEKCADTLIGSSLFKGISGGEKRRTSIGVELIGEPSLLFLDEPTSGLDSFTSLVIMTLLKQQARAGKTVIFTIHQPSYDIFNLFDSLLFLSDGNIIYQGPASDSIQYFSTIGFKCPQYVNPCDYYMEITHTEQPLSIEDQKKLEFLAKSYELEVHTTVIRRLDSLSFTNIQFPDSFRASFWQAFLIISWRTYKNFIRNKPLFLNRLIVKLIIGVITCCLYFRMSENQLQDRGGALFFIVINMFFVSIAGIVLTFPLERALFLKEYSNQMYTIGSYYMGRTMIETPFFLIAPTLFCFLVYWICGFNDSDPSKFWIFLLICLATYIIGVSMGLMAGSIFNNPNTAVSVIPTFVSPFLIFAGFVVNLDTVPVWLRWLQWISPFRFAMEALYRNEFDEGPNNPVHIFGYDFGLWPSIGLLYAYTFVWRLAAFLALSLQARKLQ